MVESCRWLAIATLLDPRFKAEGFKNPSGAAAVVSWLKEELGEDGRDWTQQMEPEDDGMVA